MAEITEITASGYRRLQAVSSILKARHISKKVKIRIYKNLSNPS
jgi:hypothetical protein